MNCLRSRFACGDRFRERRVRVLATSYSRPCWNSLTLCGLNLDRGAAAPQLTAPVLLCTIKEAAGALIVLTLKFLSSERRAGAHVHIQRNSVSIKVV